MASKFQMDEKDRTLKRANEIEDKDEKEIIDLETAKRSDYLHFNFGLDTLHLDKCIEHFKIEADAEYNECVA